VRDVLALIRCGDRINEVTTATLGPLPLDQLPKSKPVTPYAVFPDRTHPPHARKPSRGAEHERHNAHSSATIPATAPDDRR